MLRLLIAIAATVAVVLFVMVNTHHVALSFIFGQPVQVRLIFLLMLTFMLGSVLTIFISMYTKARLRRRLRAVEAGRAARDSEDDLVED